MSIPINRPCVLIRRSPGGEDRYGNVIPDENEINTVCELQPVTRNEEEDAGEMSVTKWNIYFHAEENLASVDAVQVDGTEYEFDGDSAKIWDPDLRAFSHIEATVVRAGGDE